LIPGTARKGRPSGDPPSRNRHRFRNSGMLEHHVTSARLTDIHTMRCGNRVEARDSPIAWV